MSDPFEHCHERTKLRLIQSCGIAFAVPLVLGIGAAIYLLLCFWGLSHLAKGTSRPVPPAEAVRSVAESLKRWGLFCTASGEELSYPELARSIEPRMTGVNGFTESDGFHGDGTDWYELELSRDLAAALRQSLARSNTAVKATQFHRGPSAPPWWPEVWPKDARCYNNGHESLVLTKSGTRLWFYRIRT